MTSGHSRVVVLLCVAIVAGPGCRLTIGDRTSSLPRVMLWAWERPEDLRFLDCRQAGVAVLAETLRLDGAGLHVEPRRQPIRMAPGCPTVAVVRVEAAEGAIRADMLEPVGVELLRVAHSEAIRALQIDFDALVSQRPFYRALVERLRPDMPAGVGLTITALASWCLSDDWIHRLPVDEAVPMFFQMGIDDTRIRVHLNGGGDVQSPICRSSVGLSTDEWPDTAPRGRRIYVFHPEPWSELVVSEVLQRAEAWR